MFPMSTATVDGTIATGRRPPRVCGCNRKLSEWQARPPTGPDDRYEGTLVVDVRATKTLFTSPLPVRGRV